MLTVTDLAAESASDCIVTPRVCNCSDVAEPDAASPNRFAKVGFDKAAALT